MAKYNVYYGEKHLTHHASSQCKVREENGVITFISYSTPVIIATPVKQADPESISYISEILVPEELNNPDEAYFIEYTGTYSATTRKQIGWFLKEYFGGVNYYHMKMIAGREDACVLANRKTAKYW